MKRHSSSDPPSIPDKLYFKIGEVSKIAGVPPHVLRFWESEFSKISPKRTASGQRLYTRSEVARILDIKALLYQRKFTIEGARRHLQERSRDDDAVSFKQLLHEIRDELQRLRRLTE